MLFSRTAGCAAREREHSPWLVKGRAAFQTYFPRKEGKTPTCHPPFEINVEALEESHVFPQQEGILEKEVNSISLGLTINEHCCYLVVLRYQLHFTVERNEAQRWYSTFSRKYTVSSRLTQGLFDSKTQAHSTAPAASPLPSEGSKRPGRGEA